MAIGDDIGEFFDEDDGFAEPAVYTTLAGDVADISVIVVHNVELVSQDGSGLTELRTVVSLQASQVPTPRHGETIEMQSSDISYTIDRKVSDDGALIEVSVN